MTRQPPLCVALAVAGVLAAPLTVQCSERLVWLSAAEALHVVETGDGDPVVLIPSVLSSAFGFRRVVPALVAAGHRTIAVEPLGAGHSSRPGGADYSLTAQADRIDRVLGLLRVERAVVVAHASAGSIALRLAYRHPERVAAIVSLEGGASESAATPGFRRAMRFAPLLELFGGLRRIRSRVRSALEDRSADPRWVTDAVVDGYMAGAAADLDQTLEAYRAIARAREPQELRLHLADVRCPVRLLMGGVPHDGGPSPEELALLRTRLPLFSEESVPGAGHFVSEEAPEAVVAAVRGAFVAMRTPAVAGLSGEMP